LIISYKFSDPANCHFTSFRICKILMIANQMLFIPRIVFHSLIVVDALEYHLAETVIVGHIDHLGIDQLAHQLARL
jgi:hypothetical protein